MQSVREAARFVARGMDQIPEQEDHTRLSMFGMQGESRRMGDNYSRVGTTLDSITLASPDDKCELCGRVVDVLQFICTMEGPEGEAGGFSNVVYICTYCCARGIQTATGFKAVNQLKGWYKVRNAYPKMDAKFIHKVDPDDIGIG